jgi:hypothetical protein
VILRAVRIFPWNGVFRRIQAKKRDAFQINPRVFDYIIYSIFWQSVSGFFFIETMISRSFHFRVLDCQLQKTHFCDRYLPVRCTVHEIQSVTYRLQWVLSNQFIHLADAVAFHLFTVYFTTMSNLRLYRFEWEEWKRIIKWGGCEGDMSWPNFKYYSSSCKKWRKSWKASFEIVYLCVKILTMGGIQSTGGSHCCTCSRVFIIIIIISAVFMIIAVIIIILLVPYDKEERKFYILKDCISTV